MVVSTMASALPANAAQFDTISDVMTRTMINQPSVHVITFDLPTGITLDESGTPDVLSVAFPADFDLNDAAWAAADFVFKQDETATLTSKNIVDIDEDNDPDCSSADGEDVAIGVDTATRTIYVEVCAAGGYQDSDAAGTIELTINGTTATGTGIMNNTTTVGSKKVTLSMTDEGAAAAHTADFGVGITDSDQVAITATVDPSLTFDLDTGTAKNSNSVAPYVVALGTLATTAVSTSGDGTINYVNFDLDTNAAGGATITVKNTNGANGLKSTSVPADDINIVGGDFVITIGAEEYGLCLHELISTAGTIRGASFDADGLTATAGTDTSATCVLGVHQTETALSTTAQTIVDTNSDPVAGGHGSIMIKASVSGITPAHNDYGDTLTFIATGTF